MCLSGRITPKHQENPTNYAVKFAFDALDKGLTVARQIP
jgi:hypothetical protein